MHEGGADDELAEVRLDVLSRLGLPAPPGGHRLQQQLFAQELAACLWEERRQSRRFGHAAAKGVRDKDLSGPRRLHEARNAKERVGAEFQGIAVVVPCAAKDDIDRQQAAERFRKTLPPRTVRSPPSTSV